MHAYGFVVNRAVEDDPERLAVIIDFLRYLSSYSAQVRYVHTAQSLSPVIGVPVIPMMETFIREPSPVGYAERVLGYTVVEWGRAGWDVDIMRFLMGEIDYSTLVRNVAAPEWVGDIPSIEALQEAVDAAEDEESLHFATMRQRLYLEYFYTTGDLVMRR